MGALCCAERDEENPERPAVDHKSAVPEQVEQTPVQNLDFSASEEEDEIDEPPTRQTPVAQFDDEGFMMIDLSSTGKLKMPTYPLKEQFENAMKKRMKAMLFKERLKQTVIGQQAVYLQGMSSSDEEEGEKEQDEENFKDPKEEVAPFIVPLIIEEPREPPKCWGVFARDCNGDADGAAFWAKYDRECVSWCLDVDDDDVIGACRACGRASMRVSAAGANEQEIMAFNLDAEGQAYGGPADLNDSHNGAFLATYNQECMEFNLDCEACRSARNTAQSRGSIGNTGKSRFSVIYDDLTDDEGVLTSMPLRPGEFGKGSSYQGIFRYVGGHRAQMVEFWISDEAGRAESGRVGGDDDIGAPNSSPKELFEFWIAPGDCQPVFGLLAGREIEDFSFHRGNRASGVRGIIDALDPLNPYGPKWIYNMAAKHGSQVKTLSAVTTMTGSTAATMNLSKVSAIEMDSDCEHMGDHSIEDINPLYDTRRVEPFASILMNLEHDEEYFEVRPNARGLYYDDAVDELQVFCDGVDLEPVTWIKSHINTWGISSNNWFADEIMPKLPNLEVIDFSDTIHYQHRTDLCLGIKSLLSAANDKNIRYINLSDNFLDVDGARAFAAFLEENNTLEILKISNCSLGQRSCELVLKALDNNDDLSLARIDASGNEFGKDGMELLGKLLARMAYTIEHLELRNLIFEQNLHNGLGPMLEGISQCAKLKTLDISGNSYNGQLSAIDSLIKVIQNCQKLRDLRMSHLGMNEAAAQKFVEGLRDCLTRWWGLLKQLRRLEWDENVFKHSKTINVQYVEDNLLNLYNSDLVFEAPCSDEPICEQSVSRLDQSVAISIQQV